MNDAQSSLLNRYLRVPKYLQLAEQLRARIASGELQTGDRLPSFAEMRERYGAAQKTVDKVFSLLEQEGLLVREPNRGTFVTGLTESVAEIRGPSRSVQSGLIGLSGWGFLYTESSYWARILNGMRSAARRHGMELLLLDQNSASGWEKADGVVICDLSAFRILRHLPSPQPCVSLLVEVPGVASVCADDFDGARQATEHLLELGHTRIGFLHSHDQTVTPRRLAGYRAALSKFGIEPLLRWTRGLPLGDDFGEQFINTGHEQTAKWLDEDWDDLGLTALLAQNDETAIGALQAFRENGKRVPEDVSVVGFDGLESARYASPCLTTVEVPLPELGALAIELLCEQISRDRPDPKHRTLPVNLRPGASTAPPP